MLQIRTHQPGSAIRPAAGNGLDWFRVFDQAQSRVNEWSSWSPSADLYETADEFVLEMGVPGYRPEDVDVTMENGVLSIVGRRSTREEEGRRQYHVREQVHDHFMRSFALPRSVTADDVTAEYENGMLTVRLPKVPEAKPRRVAITAR